MGACALTDAEKRANVVRLAFGGDEERLNDFVRVLRQEIPPGTGVVLRGSAVTGRRFKDDAPFDADGPGTSDLDVTLVGDQAIGLFTVTGFFIPGVHSRPLSDEDPGIAPDLVPLRETLMVMTGRPVNIQATRSAAMKFRGDTLGQPYVTLIDPEMDEGTPLRRSGRQEGTPLRRSGRQEGTPLRRSGRQEGTPLRRSGRQGETEDP